MLITSNPMTTIPKTIGILGGGQLGRMSALAAARLGIDTHIFAPEADSPAARVAAAFTHAAYEDEAALARFAQSVDAIGFEFENIPAETLDFLQKLKPVRPGPQLLRASQDRLDEKAFLNKAGIETARYALAENAEDVRRVMGEWQAEAVLIKTARFGYDGKGQVLQRGTDNLLENWTKLGTDRAIVESLVPFTCEISVIVARDVFGNAVAYPPSRNEHRGGILHKSTVPCGLDQRRVEIAIEKTLKLAEAVDLVGVMALECFVVEDAPYIMGNEIAPRTHNSGHWTIDACAVSQFENHVRCVAGLPLADPARHSDAEMINLIGADVHDLDRYLTAPRTALHLYGKRDAKPGRKMGHVTVLQS